MATEAQKRAEKKRDKKRLGAPRFAPILYTDSGEQTPDQKKEWVASVIEKHGGTRESALLSAMKLLGEKLEIDNE